MKDYIHPYVHCSIIYNRQDTEAAPVPINRWVDKKRCGIQYVNNKILLGHKKNHNEIFPLVTAWMDLEGIMLSEINQTEKDK